MYFDKKTLRRNLRHQRLKTTNQQRQWASAQATRHLAPIAQRFNQYGLNQKTIKMGVYLDAFGELPTQTLIQWATRQGFEVYVPVVRQTHQPLVFVRLNKKNIRQLRMTRHRLGMRQPAITHFIQANQLDIVFLPLVAFDTHGNRMGMGGGFYDRTLAKTKTKPLKIGYGYDFQRVDSIQANPWDIRLDMAVTPTKLWYFRRYLLPNNPEDKIESHELSEKLVSEVMNPERLTQLLAQAEAFGIVNSEDLDDF